MLRFEHSRELLVGPARPGLATVAALSGHADQAHLAREWRAIAGVSPTAWLAAELPYVQDTEGLAPAS